MPVRDDKEKIRSLIENTDTSITANIEENYIVTTEDKIRILYDEYNEVVKETGTPVGLSGILITLIISDITCDFKAIWIFSSDLVKAVFLVATVLFAILTIRSGWRYYTNREKLKFGFFINQLKGNRISENQSSEKRESHSNN